MSVTNLENTVEESRTRIMEEINCCRVGIIFHDFPETLASVSM